MKKTKQHVTKAVHATNGDSHMVGLSALRVMLLKDGNGWFAQALEIDYAACGSSLEETKKHFAVGFCKTVHEHLVMFGGIERLLKPAPLEAWQEFYNAPKGSLKRNFSTLQFHQLIEKDLELPDASVNFPFDKIAFITSDQVPEALAA